MDRLAERWPMLSADDQAALLAHAEHLVALRDDGATVRPLITQRRHVLTVTVPTEPIWLLADAGRLEQALVNLLSNAAKYTEEGGHIWLSVEAGRGERGGDNKNKWPRWQW